MFWTLCSYSISESGRPNSKLLHESSFEIMNAWTRRSVLFWSRYFLILPMFLIECMADLHRLFTCSVIFRWLSTVTPRPRDSGVGAMQQPFRWTSEMGSSWQETEMTSAQSQSCQGCKRGHFSHTRWISLTHSSRQCYSINIPFFPDHFQRMC